MPTFHRRKVGSKKKKKATIYRWIKKKEGKRGEGMRWIISRGYYAFFNAVRVSIWRGEERSVNLIGGIYFPDEFGIRRDSRRGFNRVSGPRPRALSILRIIDTLVISLTSFPLIARNEREQKDRNRKNFTERNCEIHRFCLSRNVNFPISLVGRSLVEKDPLLHRFYQKLNKFAQRGKNCQFYSYNPTSDRHISLDRK